MSPVSHAYSRGSVWCNMAAAVHIHTSLLSNPCLGTWGAIPQGSIPTDQHLNATHLFSLLVIHFNYIDSYFHVFLLCLLTFIKDDNCNVEKHASSIILPCFSSLISPCCQERSFLAANSLKILPNYNNSIYSTLAVVLSLQLFLASLWWIMECFTIRSKRFLLIVNIM